MRIAAGLGLSWAAHRRHGTPNAGVPCVYISPPGTTGGSLIRCS